LRAEILPFRPDGRPSVVAPVPDIPGCRESDTGDKPVAWTRTFGSGVEPPLRVLVAGDSISLGEGVSPEESYAGLVGAELSIRHGRPVEVVNAGVNAAGYCHVIRAVHQHVAADDFEYVVIGLFADDLEQRAVTLHDGALRADPGMVGGAIGTMATRSYVLNWVWFQVLKYAVSVQTDGGTRPAAHVTRPGRKIPERSLQNFSASVRGLNQYKPLFLLIPPVGGPLCPPEPAQGSECSWLFQDMDEMAIRLTDSGARFLDLRGLWADGEDHTQAIEQRWWRENGRLPVHPDAAGHARIAEVLINSEQIP